MDTRDEILTEAFLLRASPETVYEWLKNQPRPTTLSDFEWFRSSHPKKLELQLLERNNQIVDLALAAWGTHSITFAVLYQRWCSRAAVTAWPPKPSTFSYAILAAILSNAHAGGAIFNSVTASEASLPLNDANDEEYIEDPTPIGIPEEDFDWLIEHGDDNLLSLMHSTTAPKAHGLLIRCATKKGPYGRIEDKRWLKILSMLGRNKMLHKLSTTNDERPDLDHSRIHQHIVEAARISPKTRLAANIFWEIFYDMPTAATEKAYVEGADLNAAISAWDVELLNDQTEDWLADSDGMTPAERVQFHLLRHYDSRLNYRDLNSTSRAERLAAYARNPYGVVDGDEGGRGGLAAHLVVRDFKKYTERDGPAFKYAASFNRNIWRNREASAELLSRRILSFKNTDLFDMNHEAYLKTVSKEDELHSSELPEAIPPAVLAPTSRDVDTQKLVSVVNRLFWAVVIVGLFLVLRGL